jgi:hypothetical protein
MRQRPDPFQLLHAYSNLAEALDRQQQLSGDADGAAAARKVQAEQEANVIRQSQSAAAEAEARQRVSGIVGRFLQALLVARGGTRPK